MSYNDYFLTPKSNASLKDKLNIIASNNKRALNITKKLQETLPISPSFSKEEPIIRDKKVKDFKKEDTVLKSIANQISNLDLTNLDEEEISDQLEDILNGLDIPNVLPTIKCFLYQDLILYKKMLLSSTTKEEVLEVERLLKDLKQKLTYLDNINEERELIDTTSTNNNIFFLTSPSGRVYFLDSLKKEVPPFYYESFKELLLDIKNGTFKEIKKLQDFPFFEVKAFKVRILFVHLKDNNFLVIDGFMKKADITLSINNRFAVKEIQYQAVKDNYLTAIDNEEFQKINASYYAEIMSLLNKDELKRGL